MELQNLFDAVPALTKLPHVGEARNFMKDWLNLQNKSYLVKATQSSSTGKLFVLL